MRYAYPDMFLSEKIAALFDEELEREQKVGLLYDLLLQNKQEATDFLSEVGHIDVVKLINLFVDRYPIEFLRDWFVELRKIPWKPRMQKWV